MHGLNNKEVINSRNKYGNNQITVEKKIHFGIYY